MILAAAVSNSTSQAFWYLTRGTGTVALVLLTASVVLGIMGPLRISSVRWPRISIEMLHRQISLLVLVLLVAHIVTAVLDTFAPIRLIDAVLPFFSSYRPIWLGLGALAFDLLIALVLSSVLRRRIGLRAWRAIHWLAYASWPFTLLHTAGAGSDVKSVWLLVLSGACVAAVIAATLARVAATRPGPEAERRMRPALAALALVVPAGIAVFTLQGPLQHGWARRAGTPSTLLGGGVHRVASVRRQSLKAPVAPAPSLSATFASATVTGHMRRHTVAGGEVIDLTLALQGLSTGQLRVRLAGAPLSGGGLSLTGSQVDLGVPSTGSVLAGRVVALRGQEILAHVRDHLGHALSLHANLQIDNASGQVSGQLNALPLASTG